MHLHCFLGDVSLCELLKSGFFGPWSVMVFLDVIFIGSQSRIFWEFIYPVKDLRIGSLMWNINPSHMREMSFTFEIPSECESLSLERGPSCDERCLCLSQVSPCCPFIASYRALIIYFLVFRRIYSMYCRFLVSMGRGEFRIFLSRILKPFGQKAFKDTSFNCGFQINFFSITSLEK